MAKNTNTKNKNVLIDTVSSTTIRTVNSNNSNKTNVAELKKEFQINDYLSSETLISLNNFNSKERANAAGAQRIKNLETIVLENDNRRKDVDPEILIDNPSIIELARDLGLNIDESSYEINEQEFVADNFINSNTETFQSFNNISSQIFQDFEFEFESLLPSILLITNADFLSKNKEELQSTINLLTNEVIFSKINEVWNLNENLINENIFGKFFGLDFDIQKFSTEISNLLISTNLIKNSLEDNIFINNGNYVDYANSEISLREAILNKMGYSSFSNLINYSPNTFIADLFFDDCFSTIFQCNIINNHNSLNQVEPAQLYSTDGLEFGLYSKLYSSTETKQYSRSEHIGLPYKMLFDENIDRRNFSFNAFVSRTNASNLLNRTTLPNFLGGGGENLIGTSSQFVIAQRGDSGSPAEVQLNNERIVDSFIFNSDDQIAEIGKDYNLLNLMVNPFNGRNYSISNSLCYFLEPAFRELIRSKEQNRDFSFWGISKEIDDLKQNTIGKFKSISLENTTEIYESTKNNNSIRNSFSFISNEKNNVLFESKNISLNRGNQTSALQKSAQPVSQEIFDLILKEISETGNINNSSQTLNTNLDKITNFISILNEQSGLNTIDNIENFVDEKIMACLDSSFNFLQNAPRNLGTFGGETITYGQYYLYEFGEAKIASDNSYAKKFFKNDILSNQQNLESNPEIGLAFDLSTIDLFQRAYGFKRSNKNIDLVKAYSISCFYYCLIKLIVKKSNQTNLSRETKLIFDHLKNRFTSKFQNDSSSVVELLLTSNSRLEINKKFIFKVLKVLNNYSKISIVADGQPQPQEFNIGLPGSLTRTEEFKIDCDIETNNADSSLDFSPFDSTEEFIKTIATDPAAFAFLMARVYPITENRDKSINLFEQTYRFCESLIDNNASSFLNYDNSSYESFSSFGALGIEYFIAVSVRVVAEIMKDIFTTKFISSSRIDLENTLDEGGRAPITNFKTRETIYRRRPQTNFLPLINVAKQNYETVKNNIRTNLINSLKHSKDLLNVSNKLNVDIKNAKNLLNTFNDEIKSNDVYPYFRKIINSSLRGGNFNKKLIRSISSGYNLSLQNSIGNVNGYYPNQLLDNAADFKNKLDLSIALNSWSLSNPKTNSFVKSLGRHKVLTISLPNRFFQSYNKKEILFPVKTNTSNVTNNFLTQFERSITPDINYNVFQLKIFREDLRFLSKRPPYRNAGGRLEPEIKYINEEPIEFVFPNDLYVKSFSFKSSTKLLDNVIGNRNYLNYFAFSSNNNLASFLLNNFNFLIAKFDLKTGNDISYFELKPEQYTIDIQNLIISYAIQNNLEIKNKIPGSSFTFLSDKRFNKNIIPTLALENCYLAGQNIGIDRNEINDQLSQEKNDYDFSYKEIKFKEGLEDINSREFFVNTFLLSFCNEVNLPSKFLRQISPKAFDKIIHIPIDILLGQSNLIKFTSSESLFRFNLQSTLQSDLITNLRPELLEVFKERTRRNLVLDETKNFNNLFIGNFMVSI